MALQMSYNAPDGTSYPECYISISYILAYRETSTIVASFYADRAAYEASSNAINVGNYDCETATIEGSLFANGYTYLLTLPDFAGAIEVP